MKILVTGAAGFIGRHLCEELAAAGHKWYPVDRELNSLEDLRYPSVIERILDLGPFRPDVVIHLAAQVGRVFGEDNPAFTVDTNAVMTTRIAHACGERGIRLAYASTSEVYGDRGELECNEGGRMVLPHNIYGLSKRWGEEVCRLYALKGLTIWRISMPYGPGLPAGRGRAAMINFLYNALHGLPITVHRNSERSWCWIGDTVRAMRMTLEMTEGDIFNVGRDDNPLSMLRLAEKACDLVGAPHSLIVEVDAPERQTVVKRLSTRKIRSLGWEPHVDLTEGMQRTLDYVKTLPEPARLAAAA